ncbi:hypothetical protein [Thermococcus sp.]
MKTLRLLRAVPLRFFVMGSLMVLILSALSRIVFPSLAIGIIWLLGLSMVVLFFPDFPLTLKLSISPAVGISVLALVFHVFSLIHLGITAGTAFLILLTMLASSWSWQKLSGLKYGLIQEKNDLLRWFIPVLVVVLVHLAAYTYPTDNVDNFIHATKIKYMLVYKTTYPQVAPVFNVFSYPAGYHSLASFISLISGERVIPRIMLELRIWEWAFLAMGVYALAYLWLGKRIANYTLLSMLGVNILHYYLLVYIAPNFLGFYFFTVLLGLFVKVVESFEKQKYLLLVLTSVGSILVHPYSYQNYVFVAFVYLLLMMLEGLKFKPILKLVKVSLILFAVPVVLHILIDPYFWFPSLAHVKIEYPWASNVGITFSKLSLFHGKSPRDTWQYFETFSKWATVRNENYLGLILTIFGGLYLVYSRRIRKRGLPFIIFTLFVMFLILDRLTVNISVPLYSTANIERMFLWLVPVFPIFVGAGVHWFREAVYQFHVRDVSKKIFYSAVIGAFFLIPAVGTAHDLLAAEANFYVRADNLEDFSWVSEHFPNVTVLNSCSFDSAQWMPFFEPQSSITVMFDTNFKRCRLGNITPSKFVELLLNKSIFLPGYIAYIDTNAPSLNPLDFLWRYKLLRLNGDNWIFDLSSSNVSMNEDVVASALRLCGSSIPGNTEKYGKYFVYGFGKKYFGVRLLYLEGLEYAWMRKNTGVIAFAPCGNYSGFVLDVYSPEVQTINVTVNGEPAVVGVVLKAGETRLVVPVPLKKNVPVFVSLHVSGESLFVRSVELLR